MESMGIEASFLKSKAYCLTEGANWPRTATKANESNKYLKCFNWKSFFFMNKPSQKSAPYITALHSAICIQCSKGLSRRLLFIKAVTRPALARPSQIATYSGLLSNNRATVSPGWKPASSKTLAILLLKSSIYRATENEINQVLVKHEFVLTSLNVHSLPSKTKATLLGCALT